MRMVFQKKILENWQVKPPHFAAGWCCRHLLSWTEHTSLLVQIQADVQCASKILWIFVNFYSGVGGSTKLEKRHQTHVSNWLVASNMFLFHCLSFDLIRYLVATQTSSKSLKQCCCFVYPVFFLRKKTIFFTAKNLLFLLLF